MNEPFPRTFHPQVLPKAAKWGPSGWSRMAAPESAGGVC